MAHFALLNPQNQFHVKSEWYQNHEISTLCIANYWFSPIGAINTTESGQTQNSDQNYYRHSVHIFGQSKEFESFTDQKADEIVRHSMLCRTLSDSKLDAFSHESTIPFEEPKLKNNDFKTMPANIMTRKVSITQCEN